MISPGLRSGSVPDRVLVIHAHPDDEVFATAAATIALAEQGCQIFLRVGTGGEGGLPAYPGDPARARQIRAAQLTRSCRLLGIADWDYLAEAGRWIDTGCGGAQTLADEEPTVLAAAVRDCIDRVEPTMLLTADVGDPTSEHHLKHDDAGLGGQADWPAPASLARPFDLRSCSVSESLI